MRAPSLSLPAHPEAVRCAGRPPSECEERAKRMKQVTELKNAKRLEQAPRRCPSSTFWLVARHENRQMEVLMVGCSGEQALPVFSGEGEAKMFVRLERAF